MSNEINSLLLGMGSSYSDPYRDISSVFFPTKLKELFKWCLYFYRRNSIVNPAITKLSTTPITELLITGANDKMRDKWGSLYNDILYIKAHSQGMGLDYNTYGNGFASMYFPFTRRFICTRTNCKSANSVHDVDGLKLTPKHKEHMFEGTCGRCHKKSFFDAHDEYKSQKYRDEIRFIRWSPFGMNILHDPLTGYSEYFYKLSEAEIALNKHPAILERRPAVFLDAARKGLDIKFRQDQIFHMKRPSVSPNNEHPSGWGEPLIIAALRELYHFQLIYKADEMILHQHIVPLYVLFPDAFNATNVPAGRLVSLDTFRSKLEHELRMWRRDPNYIPIMPAPVGFKAIFGQGKLLLMADEHRTLANYILAPLKCPAEFVFGGLQYSGTSVSLRQLESTLLNDLQEHIRLVRFVKNRVRRHYGWPDVDITWHRFKMADDIQRLQLIADGSRMGKISDRSYHEQVTGLDYRAEQEQILEEIDNLISVQRKQNVAASELQIMIQNMTMRADPNSPDNVSLALPRGAVGIMADRWATQVANMPAELQNRVMSEARATAPEFYGLMVQRLGEIQMKQQAMTDMAMNGQQMLPAQQTGRLPSPSMGMGMGMGEGQGQVVNMNQAPDQLPPRSDPGNSMI